MRIIQKALIVLVLLAMPTLAFASGGHGGEGSILSNFWVKFAGQVLNFGVFAFVIYRFGAKPFRAFLLERQSGVTDEIDRAVKRVTDAQEEHAELTQRMATIESDNAEFSENYHAQSERDAQKVLDDAKRQVAQIERDAELTRATNAAMHEQKLAARLVEKSVSLAREDMIARLKKDEALRDRLIDDGIAALEFT